MNHSIYRTIKSIHPNKIIEIDQEIKQIRKEIKHIVSFAKTITSLIKKKKFKQILDDDMTEIYCDNNCCHYDHHFYKTHQIKNNSNSNKSKINNSTQKELQKLIQQIDQLI